jgi:hypothetical protein
MVLSKRKVKELVLSNKQNASRFLKKNHPETHTFIDENFSSKNKFSEKIYKYVFGESNRCIWCKVKPTSFRSFIEGYLDFCSQSCQQSNTASKYGVGNLFQSEEIKKKIRKTCQKKYGFDNPNKSDVCLKKSKSTKFDRYGDANYNNPQKNQLTCLRKYGVRYVNQVPDIIQKQQESAFNFKDYTCPSGKKVRCQGYEPLALDILHKKYDEDDIVTSKKDVPEIWYEFEEKTHRYFPDIFVKSKNLIVEVKSVYTFESKKEESLKKHEASKNSGFSHEIWVFDTKKKLVVKIL